MHGLGPRPERCHWVDEQRSHASIIRNRCASSYPSLAPCHSAGAIAASVMQEVAVLRHCLPGFALSDLPVPQALVRLMTALPFPSSCMRCDRSVSRPQVLLLLNGPQMRLPLFKAHAADTESCWIPGCNGTGDSKIGSRRLQLQSRCQLSVCCREGSCAFTQPPMPFAYRKHMPGCNAYLGMFTALR